MEKFVFDFILKPDMTSIKKLLKSKKVKSVDMRSDHLSKQGLKMY